jgi:hypothetical protein
MEHGSDPPRGDAYIYALRDETAYLHIDEDEKPEIVMERPDPSWFKCSFCRRTDQPVLFGAEYPIRDPNTFAVITHACICGDCVAQFAERLAKAGGPEAPPETA